MKKLLGIAAVVFLFSINANAQEPVQVKKEVATAKKSCCSASKDAKSSCESKKEVAVSEVKTSAAMDVQRTSNKVVAAVDAKSSCDSKKETASTDGKKACCSSKKEVATKE